MIFFTWIGNGMPNEFAHHVEIHRGTPSTNYYICSGVIVHPNWILTSVAGTCYVRIQSVIAGNQDDDVDEGTEQTVSPDSGIYFKHPTFP